MKAAELPQVIERWMIKHMRNYEQQAAFDSIRALTESDRADAVLLQGVDGAGQLQVGDVSGDEA